MAYAGKDNVSLLSQNVGGAIFRVWGYWNENEDSDATIVATDYIDDGYTLGMRIGDLFDVIEKPTAQYKRYQVTAENDPGVTLSAPAAIT